MCILSEVPVKQKGTLWGWWSLITINSVMCFRVLVENLGQSAIYFAYAHVHNCVCIFINVSPRASNSWWQWRGEGRGRGGRHGCSGWSVMVMVVMMEKEQVVHTQAMEWRHKEACRMVFIWLWMMITAGAATPPPPRSELNGISSHPLTTCRFMPSYKINV